MKTVSALVLGIIGGIVLTFSVAGIAVARALAPLNKKLEELCKQMFGGSLKGIKTKEQVIQFACDHNKAFIETSWKVIHDHVKDLADNAPNEKVKAGIYEILEGFQDLSTKVDIDKTPKTLAHSVKAMYLRIWKQVRKEEIQKAKQVAKGVKAQLRTTKNAAPAPQTPPSEKQPPKSPEIGGKPLPDLEPDLN